MRAVSHRRLEFYVRIDESCCKLNKNPLHERRLWVLPILKLLNQK